MKKILNIAWKDFLITLSDPGALILTIFTPFALTLVMIFAFGDVNNGNGISGIPVVIVNQDENNLGENLVDVFESEDLADLIIPTIMDNLPTAREAVDNDEYAALVIIPENFGEGFSPDKMENVREPTTIEIYGNPTRPTSVSVVKTIVDEFINRVSAMSAGTQVTISQMLQSGLINPADLENYIQKMGEISDSSNTSKRLITLQDSMVEGSVDAEFDWFGYIAPSMALLFLMFTVSNGGRSILAEREAGTLPRMLVSPSSATQVLGGKVFGIYVNGVTQLAVLFIASLMLLQINWGPAKVVIPTILLVVAAATGWGMLIAAFSKTPSQAAIAGTAITLIFAISSGSFFPREQLPPWLQTISLISPNAWGIEAFSSIRLGASINEMLPLWGGMIGMFVILFVISTFVFRKQYQ
jgi:ABC-2 type transport system permease protein